ncbi:hypothetical protein BU599_12015 [Staphylococcus arlettae]|uniref:esterase-like activity of phytase family protein n=1 Tax=Staphylococcus arlettae TaxID=29378 RepID=UPI000D1B2A1B|nr:esterase-like activity of phytase family protein [Staphylococcus arlettae]PTH55731.1 hypothetical protein BU599_12015 [Staphylococcus arlettae]
MNKLKQTGITCIIAFSLTTFTTLHTNNTDAANNQSDKPKTVNNIKLIDSETIPHNTKYKNTVVGGLSGISYNPQNNKWLLISDDRSEHSPSRYYEANINYNQQGFNNINFKDVNTLKQPNGSTYTNKKQYDKSSKNIVADPESIRFDPLSNHLWYTSEGDRTLGLNPFIRQATSNGTFISELPIHKPFKMSANDKQGFRNNMALEGSTFSADGQSYWTAMEGPLLQDDTVPTINSGSTSRITQYDRQGNVLAEYAYPLDAIPEKPGKNKDANNGITEILAINDHEFLALERASVQAEDNSYTNHVKVYKYSTENATNIKNMLSLKNHKVQPLKKQLVTSLNKTDLKHIDNVEGITFGKKLPNGHDTLVLVADNNFNKEQQTQIIAFEVLP